MSEFDRIAMARALALAERGLETTHPNPRVGCVVAQGERIVGEGWHEWPGEAHAEVMALRAAGENAVDSTVYVTLEPCNHFGRTPPCTKALLEARVRRLVFAMRDPNPQVAGGGAAVLRNAGIDVESGLMHDEAAELNVGWIKRMRTGRPWVRVKLAMSLDGRTALSNGASQWITGEAARADVQLWRARSSAILTGSGTILADDPQLNVRIPSARRRQPLRVVLDSNLRTPPTARLFEAASTGVVLFTTSADASRRAALEERGAQVEVLGEDAQVNLRAVLDRLGALNINEVLVEAGATLSGALIREALVDELLLYIAPMLLGHHARPLATLPELTDLSTSPRFSVIETQTIGADVRLRLRPA
jgi:diaminohydroxyphosphoribosylaminopyrimidine deaminase/5-amino-6-(5-phosphoribosylamino)uracil reductase